MAFNKSRVTDRILKEFSHSREMQRFLLDISSITETTEENEAQYRTVLLSVSNIFNPSELNARAGNFDGSMLIAYQDEFATLYSYDASNVTEQMPIYASGSPGTWVAIASNAFSVRKAKVRIDNTDSPYTVDVYEEIIFCDTDGGDITLNLPDGSDLESTNVTVRRKIINVGSSGNDVIITPDTGEKLYGSLSAFTLFDGENIDIEYDNTEGWY